MSKRREGSGAYSHLQPGKKARGIARGSDDQGECPRIKTRLPRLLPNLLLFPSRFPNQSPTTRKHFGPTRKTPRTRTFLLQTRCSLTPLLALLPFLYANYPPPVHPSVLLPDPGHAPQTPDFSASSRPKKKDSPVVRQHSLQHDISSVHRISICHKDSDTREPPLLSATRNRAISLLLNASRNVFHGYAPD
jgi:hypothetical protein